MKKIKSMKLYSSTNRFIDEYNYLKKKKKNLDILDFSTFDNLHYHGTSAVDFAIKKLGIQKDELVLDIGSGIGGPARYISYKTHCKVHAIEIQKDLNFIAELFTEKLSLKKQVFHINEDFLKKKIKKEYYDYIVCWLSLYHISKRSYYMNKIKSILKTKGKLFIEDFYLKKKLYQKEKNILKNQFFACSLVSKEEFINLFDRLNFKIIYCRDMSNNWKKYTSNRLNKFIKNNKENNIKFDLNTINNLTDFFRLSNDLLVSDIIGGIKICLVKT